MVRTLTKETNMADETKKTPSLFETTPVVPEKPKVEVKVEPEKPKAAPKHVAPAKPVVEAKPVAVEKPKVETRKDAVATLNEIEEVANKGLIFGHDRRQALRDVATLARRALGKE